MISRKTVAAFIICLTANLLPAEDSKFSLIEFESTPPRDKRLIAIASDGKDRVWAIAQEQGANLYLLEKGKWSTVPLEEFPEAITPLALKKNGDGDLIGLWRVDSSEKEIILSLHSGKNHSVIARLPAKLKEPALLPIRNGVMVTETGPTVIIARRGKAKTLIINLFENLLVAPKKRDDGTIGTDYLPVRAFEDHRELLWLWSSSMKPSEHLWRLRYPLTFEHDKFKLLTLPQMKEGGPISLIAKRNRDVVAIAAAGIGLFETNIVTDDHKRSPEGKMKFIEKIFSAGGNWYLISTPRPTETNVEMSKTLKNQLELRVNKFYDPAVNTSSLSRFEKEKLKLITNKLDVEPKFGWIDRPIVEQKDGFWTCFNEGGIVFVSYGENQALVRLDWRKGFPLKNPTQLAKAGNDFLVALDTRNGSACLIPSKVESKKTKEPKTTLRIEILETRSLLVEDSKGQIQGLLGNGKFSKWVDGKWNDWKIPEDLTKTEDIVLGDIDGEQIWVIANATGPVGVCNVSTGKWKTFKDFSDALASEMKPGERMELGDYPGLSPFSSLDSPPRICVLNQLVFLDFFDGKKWLRWEVPKIAGPDGRITGSPFFQSDGTLAVPLNHHLWALDNDKEWKRTNQSGENAEKTYRSASARPPIQCPVKNVTTTIYDKHGVCWLQDKNRMIWKSLPGCAVPLLEKNEPNPISNGATFHGICSDNKGNAFIRLDFGWGAGRYLAVAARYPLGKTDVKLKEVKGDTVALNLGKAPWHRWRFKKGEWSLGISDRELEISKLLPGDYEIEMLAYNAELVPAKNGKKLRFTITGLNESSLDDLIKQLENGDLEAKEFAAGKLRTQGPGILPKLKKASDSSNESLRWWLKAVIQRIEESRDQEQASNHNSQIWFRAEFLCFV